MVTLDTSALVRFVTKDDERKARKVKKLLEEEKRIIVPEVVLPELEYVLMGDYGLKRDEVIELYRFLKGKKNIILSKDGQAGVKLYRETRLDMADCLVVAKSFKSKLASFDKKMLKVKGVRVYWK